MADQFPELQRLFRDFLHDCWDEEVVSWSEAVRIFAAFHPAEARAAAGEVEELLAAFPAEPELSAWLLNESGAGFHPQDAVEDYFAVRGRPICREWCRELAALLAHPEAPVHLATRLSARARGALGEWFREA